MNKNKLKDIVIVFVVVALFCTSIFLVGWWGSDFGNAIKRGWEKFENIFKPDDVYLYENENQIEPINPNRSIKTFKLKQCEVTCEEDMCCYVVEAVVLEGNPEIFWDLVNIIGVTTLKVDTEFDRVGNTGLKMKLCVPKDLYYPIGISAKDVAFNNYGVQINIAPPVKCQCNEPPIISNVNIEIDGYKEILKNISQCLEPGKEYELFANARDKEDYALSYEWSTDVHTMQAKGYINKIDNWQTTLTTPTEEGEYYVGLIVTDSDGGTAEYMAGYCVADMEGEDETENIEATAPTINLFISEGPILSSNGVCYYKVTAEVTGSPAPSISFSRDDSNGAWGQKTVQINIYDPNQNITVSATATNSAGSATDTITLSWGCEVPKEEIPKEEKPKEEEEEEEEETEPTENRCPEISGIDYTETGGYSYRCKVNVTDPDGDSLTYKWSISGEGDIDWEDGDTIQCYGDTYGATFRVSVEVSDGDCVVSDEIYIEVD